MYPYDVKAHQQQIIQEHKERGETYVFVSRVVGFILYYVGGWNNKGEATEKLWEGDDYAVLNAIKLTTDDWIELRAIFEKYEKDHNTKLKIGDETIEEYFSFM